MGNLTDKVNRIKTFAIISHPDAGKTTLTEKLLLFGGAIRLAGTVKARKTAKYAVSDWMEIEKQRGISVTSSVMNFDYEGFRVNILDTPGHQDFSEDTYRTLMAADSAVMLIDGAKGVEEQTKKLFKVCRMRGIPIFTFVNKLDRASKDPFELMEEIEAVLGIRSYPMNWPIGTDGDFKGIYNRKLSQVELYKSEAHGQSVSSAKVGNVRDESFRQALGDDKYEKLCGDIDLLDIAGDKFDMDSVLSGELTPMFFGSAMTNFGVQTFLDEFLTMAPSPGKRETREGAVLPCDEEFSGFVFKIQANMDPNHRDRIAFLRICSGKYEKGMEVSHSGTGKVIKLAQSQQFFAKDREEVTEAYAGDIIGVFDPGIFGIGDTLYTGKKPIRFEGIPVFPAEHFAKVTAKDTSKRKQFLKGIKQISEEGAIQVFKQPDIGVEAFVIGVVGVLQFEVLEYRMKSEYGAEINVERLPFAFARWVMTDKEKIGSTMMGYIDSAYLVEDERKRPVILYRDQWTLKNAVEKNKDVKFLEMPPAV